MESELSPDTEKNIPPVPIKTYQWEDLRKSREAGGYPWTHLLKPPIEGEITAEDIIRETTPRRSMSREFSRSRTRSPVDEDVQKILNLDCSPGSSRKHDEEGKDEGVHVPNFSKEISLESDEDVHKPICDLIGKNSESPASSHLLTPIEIPKNLSPKGILKRRVPEQQYIGVYETREKTKCCHPLVNKIKHLADKTLHKLERNENEKSPLPKRKKNDDLQEIRQLRSSPGASRRQKFSAIKLGDSDEMSKTMSTDTPPPRKKKEHIYEDIEDSKNQDTYNNHEENSDWKKSSDSNKENEIITEKTSDDSHDPSLVREDGAIKIEEKIMEKLCKPKVIPKEATFLDDEMDAEEPNVDEIFQNQLDETRKNDSPNITITEITGEDAEATAEENSCTPIESSPTPSPHVRENKENLEYFDSKWSRPSSDHEYEIIEKPNILFTGPSNGEKSTTIKADDDLSSTTSLERKYFQHTSDEDEQTDEKLNTCDDKNEEMLTAEALQKNIEERFFINTPSSLSRTECEISTSQVDSSALENLPLKRDSRVKNSDTNDNKFQQKIKESTGKLKNQAGKLKTKLQSIKTKQFVIPDKAKFNFSERAKFKMPDRPKISLPERPKFNLPDRRKFSLPDRPRFKNINFTEKLSLGDRKKFVMPQRPKFNVPEFPKLKILDRTKINLIGLNRKKECKLENDNTELNSNSKNENADDFEAKTFPRLFKKKKKCELPKTSSSPTLNRDDTPPPTFTFTRVKKPNEQTSSHIPETPEQPREYGNTDCVHNSKNEGEERRHFDLRYDFDKIPSEYMDEETESKNFNDRNAISISDVSPSKQEYTHVINEIDNDEFFVRPRGISRENIQVREYLSDEIRQAFKIPKNALKLMDSDVDVNVDNTYINDVDIDNELDPELITENERLRRYSSDDLNERDDGYYTFPPVRPSRAKRNKKQNVLPVDYIDDVQMNDSMQFSEIDLALPEERFKIDQLNSHIDIIDRTDPEDNIDFVAKTDLTSIHEYANDDVIEYPESVPLESRTLPMPPKRKKKFGNHEVRHSSLSDLKNSLLSEPWEDTQQNDNIIVYRTEHEYTMSQNEISADKQSPVPPVRNRSRSSRGTSFCDDDRTSHGAESLTLDTNIPLIDDIEREIRHESPGYATVDKGSYVGNKEIRRSLSKTPPARRRKSNSSERKYYTVGSNKHAATPNRPPRKKSSTSLITLDSFTKRSLSPDLTQYIEINDPQVEEVHKDLNSGEIINRMKDRPLPPPPRPPRGSKKEKKNTNKQPYNEQETERTDNLFSNYKQHFQSNEVVEIEVSTQTDPLPDDVEFEYHENLDTSTNSLRDLVDDDYVLSKSLTKLTETPRLSRLSSRSDKSVKLSDPKISELSKTNIGRTSPTVILVERRVSSPTRINEREEMLTEASLTVQHIDIDESHKPEVPPLPKSKDLSSIGSPKDVSNVKVIEKINNTHGDVNLDNLVTQRLQVRDLDVGRLNVSELQANKILVSDIEGMTLQVSELDSKSGHISVSGIEFSQSVIDEIVKKFAEISTNNINTAPGNNNTASKEEHTQTDEPDSTSRCLNNEVQESPENTVSHEPANGEELNLPPQRPPPPDLTPLIYSYLQDLTVPTTSLYSGRLLRDRPISDFQETHQQTPPPPTRRAKRKPAAPRSESSSDDNRPRPSPRRMNPPVKTHEPTVIEAGAQFLRVCHNSIIKAIRNVFNSFMSYISGNENKKDVQMALVIFLVLVAGLIMFGLSDSRTIHHHHWEFFNPPDGKQ